MKNKTKWFEKIVLPISDFLLNDSLTKKLKLIQEEVRLDRNEIEGIQLKRLFEILKLARNSSPYYSSLPEVEDLEDPVKFLKSFPILDKTSLKENNEKIACQDKNFMIKMVSSGSSGVQSTIYLTKDELSMTRAIQMTWWKWAGWFPGKALIQTGLSFNRSLFKRLKDFVFRTKYVLAFDHDEKEIKNLLLTSKGFQTLAGYASSLYVMAQIAQKNGLDKKFDQVISWGDKMFPHYRSLIEKQFQTKVFETYGTTEGIMLAAQYDTKELCLMDPYFFLEILDHNGNEVPDGEMGRVVVTSLIAKGFPLIRYDLGDLAIRLPDEEFPKNNNIGLKRLKMVVGRNTDIVRTPSGKSLIVHSFTGIFEYYPQVHQFRVIQENLAGVEIEVIPDKGFTDDLLGEIKNKLSNLISEPFDIKFKIVDFIPSTASGKPQIIKSTLPLF